MLNEIRIFETGATRSQDKHKVDFEGALSPYALARFAKYMLEHNTQADGNIRESDNWQLGIPRKEYILCPECEKQIPLYQLMEL